MSHNSGTNEESATAVGASQFGRGLRWIADPFEGSDSGRITLLGGDRDAVPNGYLEVAVSVRAQAQ